jgi:hypothetical protein
MQSSQQQRALSFEQFVGLLERKSVIPGVLSVHEASKLLTYFAAVLVRLYINI